MSEQNQIDKTALIAPLMEHHRFYVNRNWQFFGGILLVNSILLNSIDTLLKEHLQLVVISFSFVLLIGTFYHLINWTNMRIDTNMAKINALTGKYKTESPSSPFEGMISWMKFAIIVLTLPYYFFAYTVSIYVVAGLVLSFLVLVMISEVTTRKFLKKMKGSEGQQNKSQHKSR
ncbi:MAG: hypothetical protein L6461_07405 [Anaerolineae bacterium]|nr:hypothetical protein [Anaerolineae bacterium]